MLNRLKQYFYWPGMGSLIYKKCESYLICATAQGQERRQNLELQSIPVGEPFSCIGMDFKEIDESFDNNHYALVFQDYLSKWPEVYAVADRTASTVAKCLADVIYRHRVPSTIIHDRAQSSYQTYYKTLLLSWQSNNYPHHLRIHNATA